MTKVHVKDRFDTSFGLVLVVQAEQNIRVGGVIQDDAGNSYSIKELQFPSRPTEEDLVGLVVEKIS